MDAAESITLERVLKDLAPTLLAVLMGDPAQADDVEGIVIYDPDEPNLPAHAIVLAVAARSSDDITAVVNRAGGQGASAVVVRTPVDLSDGGPLKAAVDASGVVLLGLTAGASWTQLAVLVSSMLGVRAYMRDNPDLATPAGDLFALANVVSDLVDAPITIEDRNSRVLAFSGRQEETDQARIDTIIGRRVPGRITETLQARGVFKELHSSERPIYVAPVTAQDMPRIAVGVRVGSEIFGSIWAAVRAPLAPEREQTFIDCAKLVALHMLRQAVASDVTRQFKAQRILSLLEGDSGAVDAARALGLAQPLIVWAWGFSPAYQSSSFQHAEAERQRILDVLRFQVSALHPSAGVATLGDVAYAVIPVSEQISDAEDRYVRAAQSFLQRTCHEFTGKIGVSRVATNPSGLPAARRDADRALRALEARGAEGKAAGISALNIEALMLELRDLATANGHQPADSVARLQRYDREKNADLTGTLRTWLDSFGDVRAAAAAMHVHANTFRYRMRRAAEVGGIDLNTLSGRFALMVELRLAAPHVVPHAEE